MYHCRGGLADLDGPRELVPASHSRSLSESWPSPPRTFAFAQKADRYVASLCANATVPQIPPEEYPRLRIDHRLGPHDPMLYPQVWNSTVPHSAWVERRELHRDLHRGHITAYVFQFHDWEPVSEGASYGRISGQLLSRLEGAFYDIHLRILPLLARARTRLLLPTSTITECTCLLSDLQTLTSTFSESARLVTRIQRGIAELLAFRLFRLDVEHHVPDQHFVSDRMFDYVGVFTADDAIANLLHRLGVPVFLLLRRLPRSVALQNVVQPLPWNAVVEVRCLASLSGDELAATDIAESSHSVPTPPIASPRARAVPSARSARPRSPSPPRRLRGNNSLEDENKTSRRSSGRSRSPARRSARPSGASRAPFRAPSPDTVSKVPRYILHEQPRITDEKKRQHPDAPEQWRPRTWSTDPGNQASLEFKLPDWAPQLPPWISTVASSVDRSTNREWRLSTADTAHAVPQELFTRPLEYMLPPVHLLLKHEKRFLYVIKAWLALRDFWLRRIMEDESCSLTAGTWRRVLDDKYHVNKELAHWVESQREALQLSRAPSSVPEAATQWQAQDDGLRVSSLGTQLRNALSQQLGSVSNIPTTLTGAYTRAREPGEDLPAPSSRDVVEPEDWPLRVRGAAIFCEARPRSMVFMDSTALSAASTGSTQWDEYWDYENGRILLFDRASRIPDEQPVLEGGEIVLRDGALTWHQSPDDECGLCVSSRAMWCPTTPLVTNDAKRLVLDRALTAAAQPASSTRDYSGIQTASASATYPPGTGTKVDKDRHSQQAPPPDPVYGYERELPNGQHAVRFVFRNQVLTPADLDRREVRAFVIWELEEATFRLQLRRTDTWVLKSMGLWSRDLQTQRNALLQRCWGGNDSFVPSGKEIPALTNPDPRKRVIAIRNFWTLVRAWPRAAEVAQLRALAEHGELSVEHILQLEREVWKFYAQTFYDYFGILPTLPKLMPPNPFSDRAPT